MAAGLHGAILAPVSPYQEAIWTAALELAGLATQSIGPADSVARFAAETAPTALLVLDLRRLAEESRDLIAYANALRERRPAQTWIAALDACVSVTQSARTLARSVGARDLVALIDHRDLPSLRTVSEALAQAGVDVELVLIEGARHAFELTPLDGEEMVISLEKIDAFITRVFSP